MSKCLTVASEVKPFETEREVRRQICRTGRKMYARCFVVASEGNLSMRLDRDRIIVTPAGVCKGYLAPEDLLVTELCGEVLRGDGQPSTEMQTHLLHYRLRHDVQAVCHAHPPTATGIAVAGRALRTNRSSRSDRRPRQDSVGAIWNTGHLGALRAS